MTLKLPAILLLCACAFAASRSETHAQFFSFDDALLVPSVGTPATIEILKNGFVFETPEYPYKGNQYKYDVTPGDNDLPWLRSYAAYKHIFAGIDMSLEWKEREWDMMKAIINHTAQTLPFSGVNTDPSIIFRAKLILTGAMEHPDYFWGCGEIGQAAVGLAQAFGIPARMVNGRDFVNECSGDFCCEMFSTRFNRWVFLMPHVNAWIEHEDLGPLGIAQLRQFDLAGLIQATYIPEYTIPYVIDGIPQLDDSGQPIMLTIYGHYEATPSPPLMFMPSTSNIAALPPYMTINWWSGRFHRMQVSYITTLQQQYPNMAEVFSDDSLNQTTCSPFPPVPVVEVDDLNISYPLNNVQASAQIFGNSVLIKLKHNMIDFVDYEIKVDNDEWRTIDLPLNPMTGTYLWIPGGSTSMMMIRGITQAGVTSPDVVLRYRPAVMGDLADFIDG